MNDRSRVRIRRTGRRISVLWVAFFALSAAQAEQLVTFTRGQSIVVQGVEKRGAWYYFTLDRGGEMGVPVNRVASIKEYEAPPASPASAPSQAAAAAGPPPLQGSAVPAPQGGPATPSDSPGAQQANGADPAASTAPNVTAPGEDDWRYKVRMSGGPRRKEGMNPNGPGGPAGRGPMAGGRMPPGQRRYPPQPPNPQN